MEEIDYSWKLMLSGYKNLVEPKSIVYHSGGTLKDRTFLKSYFNHRNSMILFLTNHHPLAMLSLLIPKLFLELVSLLRYLLTANLKGFVAQILACLWIVLHPIYMVKRVIDINRIKKASLLSILSKLYKPSIVLEYFILRKKKYSDLVN